MSPGVTADMYEHESKAQTSAVFTWGHVKGQMRILI